VVAPTHFRDRSIQTNLFFCRAARRGIPPASAYDPHPSPFVRDKGGGSRHNKMSKWGEGGLQHSGGEGGTPTPSTRYPTSPDRNRRGSPPSPARRRLHAKYTFWDWNDAGGSPVFARRGVVGVCLRKWKTKGRGVATILEGTPPHLGKRRGVVGGLGPVFSKNAQQAIRGFSGILSNEPEDFLKFLAAEPNLFLYGRRVSQGIRRRVR